MRLPQVWQGRFRIHAEAPANGTPQGRSESSSATRSSAADGCFDLPLTMASTIVVQQEQTPHQTLDRKPGQLALLRGRDRRFIDAEKRGSLSLGPGAVGAPR